MVIPAKLIYWDSCWKQAGVKSYYLAGGKGWESSLVAQSVKNLPAMQETCLGRFHFYSSTMQKNFRLSIYKKNHSNIFNLLKIVILVWYCQMNTYISQSNRIKNPEVNCYIESYFSTKVQRQFNREMIVCSTNCAKMIIQNMCNLNPYLI